MIWKKVQKRNESDLEYCGIPLKKRTFSKRSRAGQRSGIVRAVVLRPQIKVSGIDPSLEKTSRPLIRFNSVALKLAPVPTLIRHGYYLSKAVDWPSVWHVWKMVSNQLPRNPMGVSNWIDERKKKNLSFCSFLLKCWYFEQELHNENVLAIASGSGSLDEQEQGLRHMHLGNPDDVEPILRKRQYVLQVKWLSILYLFVLCPPWYLLTMYFGRITMTCFILGSPMAVDDGYRGDTRCLHGNVSTIGISDWEIDIESWDG